MRRLKSNAALVKAHKGAVDRLSKSDDPTSLGKRLRGRHAAFYECRLPGSYGLAYSVDRDARRAVPSGIGGHKELFERHNR